MKERFVKHATFVVEKTYAAPPERVYQAWADPEAKAKWFSKADIFDFQVGGREYSSGGPPEGPVFVFDAVYQEIVPGQRIVYTYTLDSDGVRISVSITTIELIPVDGGTTLVFTEQERSSTAWIRRKCASTVRTRCWTRWARRWRS